MKIRLVALATASVAALAVSSCSSVSNTAATVGDASLSVRDLEHHLDELSAAQADTYLNPNGSISATGVRSLLAAWVGSQVLAEVVAAEGGSVSDEDRAAAAAQIPEGVDDSTRDFLTEIQAVSSAYDRVATVDSDVIRAAYELGPESSGIACLRGLVASTAADAQVALDRIRAGEAFAAVADELAPDANGGIVADPNTGAECIPPDALASPTLLAATSAVEIGEPTDIVDLGGAFAILLVRPFDEVAEDATAQLSAQLVLLQRGDELSGAEGIRVNSQYGVWDPENAVIVPLS